MNIPSHEYPFSCTFLAFIFIYIVYFLFKSKPKKKIPSPLEVAASPVILSDKLIMEILSFFPVKSLMRMKCVCSSWKTLISDPNFVELHFKKQSTRNTTHLAVLHTEYKSRPSCVISIFASHLLKSTSKPYYRFKFNSWFDGKIIGSCNGLICWKSPRDRKQESQFYLWNPTTRTDLEELYPYKSLHEHDKCWFAFGYDNSTNTYKVVALSFIIDNFKQNQVSPTARVFTFGDNIWRDIQSFPVAVLINPHTLTEQSGVYLNNSVNWLVRCQYYCYLKNITSERFEIISLDLGTETYTQFLLPQCCWEMPLDSLSVFMDCLCFSYYNANKSDFVLWKMKKFGVEESWTQFLKISNLNVQVQIYGIRVYGLTPLCFSENGDMLIFAMNQNGEAIFYDWRNNRVKKIVNTNISNLHRAKGYFESFYQLAERSPEATPKEQKQLLSFSYK